MNKLTPGSNIRWESSRMVLPEHRESLIYRNHESKRKTKREFDEQYMQEIGNTLAEAHRTRTPVNVRMFDEYEDIRVIGVIDRLDAVNKRYMVDGEWFRVDDIEEIDVE